MRILLILSLLSFSCLAQTWQKKLIADSTDDYIRHIITTPDHQILISYNQWTPGNPYAGRSCLVSLDTSGNVNWSKIFAGHEVINRDLLLNGNNEILQLTDHKHKRYIRKLDLNGNILKTVQVGDSALGSPSDLELSYDGTFYYAGAAGTDISLIRFDENLEMLWSRRIHLPVSSRPYHLIELDNHNILVCAQLFNQPLFRWESAFITIDPSGVIISSTKTVTNSSFIGIKNRNGVHVWSGTKGGLIRYQLDVAGNAESTATFFHLTDSSEFVFAEEVINVGNNYIVTGSGRSSFFLEFSENGSLLNARQTTEDADYFSTRAMTSMNGSLYAGSVTIRRFNNRDHAELTIVRSSCIDQLTCTKEPVVNQYTIPIQYEDCPATLQLGEIVKTIHSSALSNHIQLDPKRCQGNELSNGCALLSSNEILQPPVKIYPNPASKNVHIEGIREAWLTLTDVAGRVTKQVHITSSTASIDISQLSPGVYFLDCGDHRSKLIIEK